MHINPIAIASGEFTNLVQIQWPNPGTYDFLNATYDLGIIWADPSDHTKQFRPESGIDLTNGSRLNAVNWQSPKSYNGSTQDVSWRIYNVDASGADISLLWEGGINGFDPFTPPHVSLMFEQFAPSIVIPPKTIAHGLRAELHSEGGDGGDYLTFRVPETMLFIGGPGA